MRVGIRQFEFSLPDNHLMEFSEPLLAFVSLELAPKLSLTVYYFESLVVVPRQLYFLPKLVWQVSPLSCLEIQVALVLMLEDSGVPRIG